MKFVKFELIVQKSDQQECARHDRRACDEQESEERVANEGESRTGSQLCLLHRMQHRQHGSCRHASRNPTSRAGNTLANHQGSPRLLLIYYCL